MKHPLTADRFRIWLAIALLAIVAIGSFWILEAIRRSDVEGNSRASARSDPDYYVENFNFIRLSNNGQTNYRINGERMTHYPRSDGYEIQQPRIKSFSAEKTPLNIRAERGVVEQKTQEITPKREFDQIHLLGDVKVDRPKTATSNAMKLESEYLLLLPDQDSMKTDKPVKMTTDTSEVNAVGMTANNAAEQLQLLSKVRARFSRPGTTLKPDS
jgi:lipopolysaccharide export system protein LptC